MFFAPRTPTSALTADFVGEGCDSPLTQQYSLDVEYEFAPRTMLEVGFVGSRGNRLSMTRNINEPLLASPSNPVNGITTNTVANAGQRVPILGFAPNGLVSIETLGASMYNSMQVVVKRQFSHGIQFQGAYTYSKAMTNVGGKGFNAVFQGGDGNSNSPVDLKQQYGPSDYDRTNRFILNYLWELPRPSNGFLGTKVLGGWTFSGVATIQSGDALTLVDPSGGSIFGGAGNSRAQLCPGFLPGQIPTSGGVEDRLNNYFNTNAFCPPPSIGDGTGYGNTRRGTVRGPHQANLDMALSKRVVVGGVNEAAALEFRAEFFNTLNHPQFADPGVSLGSPSFGKIQSTAVAPRLIQFALKYSF